MNVQAALQAGALLRDAYKGYELKLPNYDGQQYQGFTVLQTIYTNDLATDLSPRIDPLINVVPIGFVARNDQAADEYAIVVRGTEGVWEWIQDAKLIPIPFTAVSGGGLTEDGFTDMYNSFRVGPDPNAARLVPTLTKLLGKVSKLTICGHSLGSALATMLTLDIVVNTPYKQPTLYTYASPSVGDLHFANFFNAMVPDAHRIANRMDIVAHVPLPPLYIHVGDETELVPGIAVDNNVLCQHDMATYMHLLSNGATSLKDTCTPKPSIVDKLLTSL